MSLVDVDPVANRMGVTGAQDKIDMAYRTSRGLGKMSGGAESRDTNGLSRVTWMTLCFHVPHFTLDQPVCDITSLVFVIIQVRERTCALEIVAS